MHGKFGEKPFSSVYWWGVNRSASEIAIDSSSSRNSFG